MLATHDGDFIGSPPSGNVVDLFGTDVFTVGEDGRVVEIRAYYDSATVLRQLDLF
jgi:predicted ester cyclase